MKGYMCFFEDMTDLQHDKFKIGERYNKDDKNKRFVIYEYLEDSLRNYHAERNNVNICFVLGYGDGRKIEDTASDYIERYEFDNVAIIKEVPREFIIEYGLNLYDQRLIRFLQGFKLTNEEKDLFRLKFEGDRRAFPIIDYYINGNIYAFKEALEKEKHIKL